MQVQPILAFNGRGDEALEFYGKALGAEVTTMMRWKDSPDPGMCASARGFEDKIMHATFRIGETTLMATDGMTATSEPVFKGITLSLEVPNDAEAKRLFAALSDGGQVHMPLAKMFWSSSSGMVTDRFGVMWMVNAAAKTGNRETSVLLQAVS
jgi:PhnB protein